MSSRFDRILNDINESRAEERGRAQASTTDLANVTALVPIDEKQIAFIKTGHKRPAAINGVAIANINGEETHLVLYTAAGKPHKAKISPELYQALDLVFQSIVENHQAEMVSHVMKANPAFE